MPAAATYEPIATYTVPNSTTDSVSFSAISQLYTDIVVSASGRSLKPTAISNELYMRFNDDAGANYQMYRFIGGAAGLIPALDSNTTQAAPGVWPTPQQTSFDYGFTLVNIMNYSNTNTYKTLIGRTVDPRDWVVSSVITWYSTNAINKITFTLGGGWYFKQNTTFTLFGIKAA